MDSAVLRELGAETRTFRTVKGAIVFYRDYLAAQLRVNCDPDSRGTPLSAAGRQIRNATFAAIAACLKTSHYADEDGSGLQIFPDGRSQGQPAWHTGEALAWLVAWYENGTDDNTDLAEEAGLVVVHRNPDAGDLAMRAGIARKVFNRRCRKVRERLQKRLKAAGLLEPI